jgi:ubiquinone/menaquinone biosynthesis C-methylase UbiE
MSGTSEKNNVYFIDPESAAEAARLTNQDRIVTQYMGGHFPEFTDLSSIRRVLDVACGPGGWAQEVAFAHPEMDVVGFDISETMIKYANTQAKVQGLENATFHVMDMLKLLDFADGSFDLTNARFITFLPAEGWHNLAKEMGRVTRPGGYIRLTETEWWCFSSSPALGELNSLIVRSINGPASGPLTGIWPKMGQLLKEAGCSNIQYKSYAIDYSYGSPAYETFLKDAEIIFKLSQPQLVAFGLATQEELDALYNQMLVEMMQESFSALFLLVTALGQKPD